MNEDQVKAEIRKYFGLRPDVRLFNNPVGTGYVSSEVARPLPGVTVLKHARVVDFGLIKGSSDLIGWVTQNGIARFLAVEVKTERGRATDDQVNYIQQVRAAGGIAGVVRSTADVENLLAGREYSGMNR